MPDVPSNSSEIRLGSCSLRPMTRDDLDMVLTWRNLDRVRAFMFTDHEISYEEHILWFRRVQEDTASFYSIFQIDDRPVGLTSVTKLDRRNGTASVGLYVGETDVGKGTGSRLLYMALEWAFRNLGARELSCEALDFNERAIRLYTKFGFKREQGQQKRFLKGTEHRDVVVFGLRVDEWEVIRPRLKQELFGPSPEPASGAQIGVQCR